MAKNNTFDRYYAIPSDLIHDGKKEDILRLYGSLISSDKTKKVTIYSNEIDWNKWPKNIALLFIIGVIGFLLSSGNFFVVLFVVFVIAPLYHWKKVRGVISYLDVPESRNKTKPMTEIGKESLNDHLVEIGQISEKS